MCVLERGDSTFLTHYTNEVDILAHICDKMQLL